MEPETLRDLLRCDDCAFTAGTAASSHEPTRLKALLCVQGLEHFYCHVNKDEDGGRALCGGWLEAVHAVSARGGYRPEDQWRRDVLRGLNDVLMAAQNGLVNLDDDEEMIQAIRAAILPEWMEP
jgi:hypothetical protein